MEIQKTSELLNKIQLREEEKTIWHGGPNSEGSGNALFYMKAGSLFATMVIIVLTIITKELSLLFLLAVLLSGLAFAYHHFIIGLTQYYYLATNERVLILHKTQKKILREMDYRDMFQLKVQTQGKGKKKLLFLDQPRSKPDDNQLPLSFDFLTDHEEALSAIGAVFEQENPYALTNAALEAIAKEEGLSYEALDRRTYSPKAKMKGKINGLQLEALLVGAFPFESFKVSISCPNPEDNYLWLRQENLLTGVKTMLGEQDLIIGNKRFDDRFFVNTDNEAFTRKILTEKIQELMMGAAELGVGSFQFGKPTSNDEQGARTSSRKFKDDDQVLDLHLLENKAKTREVLSHKTEKTEGKMTSLVYSIAFPLRFRHRDKNVINLVEYGLQATIDLAVAIDEYSKDV